MVGEEGWENSTVEGCEKNTQAHTPAIQINFKAEVEEIPCQWAQGFSFDEERVHRSREGRNNQSQRKKLKKKKTPVDSNLQIKKQSNQSCQRALIPGCSFQAAGEWNGTRLEYANLFALSGRLGRGGGGGGESEKINGHSGGQHKGLLKVYCHKH